MGFACFLEQLGKTLGMASRQLLVRRTQEREISPCTAMDGGFKNSAMVFAIRSLPFNAAGSGRLSCIPPSACRGDAMLALVRGRRPCFFSAWSRAACLPVAIRSNTGVDLSFWAASGNASLPSDLQNT